MSTAKNIIITTTYYYYTFLFYSKGYTKQERNVVYTIYFHFHDELYPIDIN